MAALPEVSQLKDGRGAGPGDDHVSTRVVLFHPVGEREDFSRHARTAQTRTHPFIIFRARLVVDHGLARTGCETRQQSSSTASLMLLAAAASSEDEDREAAVRPRASVLDLATHRVARVDDVVPLKIRRVASKLIKVVWTIRDSQPVRHSRIDVLFVQETGHLGSNHPAMITGTQVKPPIPMITRASLCG